MDPFESFFRQADVDGDGRISGMEAIAFFRGAGLPQIVLAKIWQLADQAQRGFLTKPEFFHALKLVTVAQSGRELTPEISRAALLGPASTQIPPPRIIPAQVPVSSPSPPPAYRPPLQNQRVSYTGQQPGLTPEPPARPFQPPPPAPVATTSAATPDAFGAPSFQAFPEAPKALVSQVSTSSILGATPSSSTTPTSVSTAPAVSSAPTSFAADGFGGESFKASPSPRPVLPDDFGGDSFFADSSQAIVPVATLGPSPTVGLGTAIVPVTALAPTPPPTPPPVQTFGQPVEVPSSPARPYAPPVQNIHHTWPKMTQGDIERYSQAFASVDSDRDGKVRGDQARDVFLSWGLPRDVLKKIWDLSDQDGDSMLSLREFCIALYFMERYREGRPPPSVLPAGFLPENPSPSPQQFVPTPVRPPVLPPQRSLGPGVPVIPQETGPVTLPGSQGAGLMPLQATADSAPAAQTIQYKSRAPPLEPELVTQLNRDDQGNLKSKYQEAEILDRKVFDLDKDIKHATEMIDFYRAKLQEIILFKTRTDNHLLEITERVASDKREVEALRKKYDQKFQQAGESNSRLLAEEAAFHDIQRRKMELYTTIAKIDQSAKKEGLQERAEEISGDLNELKTLLNQRAKKLGLRARPSSAMELPFGWQPGIQENAVDWDDWDKFDDEGFSYFQQVEETKKPAEEKKVAEEKKAADKKAEDSPSENGSTETLKENHVEEKSPDANTLEEKPEENAPEKPEEKPVEHEQRPPERKNSVPDWSSVFGDEPAWNLSQDFGKNAAVDGQVSSSGGFMGLRSIKTSTSAATSIAGDASVPETPLFSTLSPPTLDDQRSVRGGDESAPETPLFKSPDQQGSRSSFARFDSFGHHGIFDDPGTSFDGTNQWSTF
ncbi:actin cytoskeleton-regulatory complex protein pan1 isoform X2 [Selaginella moellendorffii]|uniref:actin cytoskeleton-regulatory complex protein pan1 isoform X2 n=1 Tax=Selaginella moellendorffii TaxID=88036 RepID=UPI000D1C6CA0|nr:actin cytoskeleton-regulatory complex protein pan1 isoform X2 [Selaginella moellendorffii]|eukprot:XP_024524130.1 actin cytoskeleton-regulatory complex protein pan1 isoform X2 [Selaginella moellendorffii]